METLLEKMSQLESELDSNQFDLTPDESTQIIYQFSVMRYMLKKSDTKQGNVDRVAEQLRAVETFLEKYRR